MRVVIVREFGAADGLVVAEAPEPEPAAGQLLVQVEAIGVGGVDAVIRRGTLSGYGFRPGIGGPAMPSFLERLADNGRLVSVGVVGGHPPADFGMTLLRSFQRSRSFATFGLNTVPVGARNAVRAGQFAAAARGELRPVVHDVLRLDEAAEAHRRMDAGEVFGRIVLTP